MVDNTLTPPPAPPADPVRPGLGMDAITGIFTGRSGTVLILLTFLLVWTFFVAKSAYYYGSRDGKGTTIALDAAVQDELLWRWGPCLDCGCPLEAVTVAIVSNRGQKEKPIAQLRLVCNNAGPKHVGKVDLVPMIDRTKSPVPAVPVPPPSTQQGG